MRDPKVIAASLIAAGEAIRALVKEHEYEKARAQQWSDDWAKERAETDRLRVEVKALRECVCAGATCNARKWHAEIPTA